MNMDDIKSFTVNDLKRELKARNLPVSGNKPDLIQRLTDYIAANDEHILDTSGRVDESLLEGVHEDEVLGIISGDTPKPTPPTPAKKTALKRDPAPPAATIQRAVSAETAPQPPRPISTESQGEATSDKQLEAKKIQLKSSISSDSETTPSITAKIPVTVSDPEKQKIERAKKFNLPLQEPDRKILRAARFGLPTAAAGAKTAAPTSLDTTNVGLDPSLLEKRAKRFGFSVVKTSKAATTAPIAVDNEKLTQRAQRFGLQKQQEKTSQEANGAGQGGGDNEQILKRKMRFGGGGSTTAGDGDDKKKARAARFGLK